MLLLQKEFPNLKSYLLPNYHITYAKSKWFFKIKLLFRLPLIIFAIIKEKQRIDEIVKNENVVGIISDNRFGVFNAKIPSVYITHQITVLAGLFTCITTKIHQKIIQNFDECWIPDISNSENFSGKLGHVKHTFKSKYIGILSRFKPQNLDIKYAFLVLLSGPEPQRTLLENILLKELKNVTKPVLFVRGVFSDKELISTQQNIEIVNYLLGENLEKALNQSNLVIARSGYSTIMDLAVLGKKAYFIPTPGQTEQMYLAKLLKKKQIASFAEQHKFQLSAIEDTTNFSGFSRTKASLNFNLFELF